MDWRTWVVVVLYGLVLGLLLGRFRAEGRIVLGAMAAMSAIGAFTWIVAPSSIAGPSMTVGGAVSWLATFATRER